MKINNYVWENDFSLNDLVLQQKEKIEQLQTQLQQKENIIKEVREYIEDRYDGEALIHTFDKDNVKELLEILDKENK